MWKWIDWALLGYMLAIFLVTVGVIGLFIALFIDAIFRGMGVR